MISPDYNIRGLNADRVEAIKKYGLGAMLDVGCGNGNYVNHFSGKLSIKGCDYIKFEGWNSNPHLFSLCNLNDGMKGYENKSYDTILCFEVLEHLSNFEFIISEFKRVAKRRVIATVPNCDLTVGMKNSGLIFNHWIDRTHVNFFNKESIEEKFKEAGFNNITVSYINKINPTFFIQEFLGIKNKFLNKIIFKLLTFLPNKKNYYMTLLVVGDIS